MDMQELMCNELTGDEQYRRDEEVRIEALYEYAVQRTSLTGNSTYIIGDYWADREDRENFIKEMEEFGTRRTYTLVRRRKAGPVEEVN